MPEIKDLQKQRTGGRCCANCAAFQPLAVEGAPPGRGLCTVAPPVNEERTLQEPRIRNGKPDVDKRTGEVITVAVKRRVVAHPLTLADLACDKWKPLGTWPGESSLAATFRVAGPKIVEAMNQRMLSPAEMFGIMLSLFGAELPAGVPGAELAREFGLAPGGDFTGDSAENDGEGSRNGSTKEVH